MKQVVLILVLIFSGCGSFIRDAMVHAPNKGQEIAEEPSPDWMVRKAGADRELRVKVGPPEARLRVWIVEPPDEFAKPTGTLLVMHGYRGSMSWVKKTGQKLAKAGYRVAMIDMRGHGRSTGDFITYGVVESRDASQVIDALQAEGMIAGNIGVWGVSMGAATAIKLAANDERVKAVVAVAPYTSMREVVPDVVRLILPPYGLFVSDESILARVDEAGERAGFDPDEADVLQAMKRVNVPTMIIHGTADWVVHEEHGRALYEANRDMTEFIELPWTGHLRAHYSSTMRKHSIRWFDTHLR